MENSNNEFYSPEEICSSDAYRLARWFLYYKLNRRRVGFVRRVFGLMTDDIVHESIMQLLRQPRGRHVELSTYVCNSVKYTVGKLQTKAMFTKYRNSGPLEDLEAASEIEERNKLDGTIPADVSLLHEALEQVLRTLPCKIGPILRARFGFDDGVRMTLKQVGELYDVSRERIRQLERDGLVLCRMKYRTAKLAAFLPEEYDFDEESEFQKMDRKRRLDAKKYQFRKTHGAELEDVMGISLEEVA